MKIIPPLPLCFLDWMSKPKAKGWLACFYGTSYPCQVEGVTIYRNFYLFSVLYNRRKES
ncbi:hypothetical protein Hanom_Chr15g01358621 [Helianthus anomalus]